MQYRVDDDLEANDSSSLIEILRSCVRDATGGDVADGEPIANLLDSMSTINFVLAIEARLELELDDDAATKKVFEGNLAAIARLCAAKLREKEDGVDLPFALKREISFAKRHRGTVSVVLIDAGGRALGRDGRLHTNIERVGLRVEDTVLTGSCSDEAPYDVALVLPQTPVANASIVGERLRAAIAEQLPCAASTLRFVCAGYPMDASDAPDLLRVLSEKLAIDGKGHAVV